MKRRLAAAGLALMALAPGARAQLSAAAAIMSGAASDKSLKLQLDDKRPPNLQARPERVVPERVRICYNYGCEAEATATYSEAQLRQIRTRLQQAGSAAQERAALAEVIGQLYYWAGQQTPVYADRGGNYYDAAVNGAMDCIDHSTTTTRLLQMLERRGWLKYHEVGDRERRRSLIFEHWTAVVEEKPHPWLEPQRSFKDEAEEIDLSDQPEPHEYAVDSWFRDNGKPAVVIPLDEWKHGGGTIESSAEAEQAPER